MPSEKARYEIGSLFYVNPQNPYSQQPINETEKTHIRFLNFMCLSGRIISNVFLFLLHCFFQIKKKFKEKIHVYTSD